MYGTYRAATLAELAEAGSGFRPRSPGRHGGRVQPRGRRPGRPWVRPEGRLDDLPTTEGLTPPKSHWALPIDRPPFYGVPMRPGITFTYMGVAVDERARVQRAPDGSAFANIFAAGEIMSGNILSTGYLAGFGLTIGTVWGRLAGAGAA